MCCILQVYTFYMTTLTFPVLAPVTSNSICIEQSIDKKSIKHESVAPICQRTEYVYLCLSLHKDVYARVIHQCKQLCKPLCCLGHSSSLGYGWHHSQESPSICPARHSEVVAAGGQAGGWPCKEQSIRIYMLCVYN